MAMPIPQNFWEGNRFGMPRFPRREPYRPTQNPVVADALATTAPQGLFGGDQFSGGQNPSEAGVQTQPGQPGVGVLGGVVAPALSAMMGPAGMVANMFGGWRGLGMAVADALGLSGPATGAPGTTGSQTAADAMAQESAAQQAHSDAIAGLGPDVGGGGDTGSPDAGVGGMGENSPGTEGGGGMFRRGGRIPSDRDTLIEPVPAVLHEGEYVIRPEMVKKYGPVLLNAINEGRLSAKKVKGLFGR